MNKLKNDISAKAYNEAHNKKETRKASQDGDANEKNEIQQGRREKKRKEPHSIWH